MKVYFLTSSQAFAGINKEAEETYKAITSLCDLVEEAVQLPAVRSPNNAKLEEYLKNAARYADSVNAAADVQLTSNGSLLESFLSDVKEIQDQWTVRKVVAGKRNLEKLKDLKGRIDSLVSNAMV